MNQLSQNQTKLKKGWEGRLDLVYSQCQDETQVTHNHFVAPLKVQRPFYPEGKDVCHSVILHTAGGVVGGDRLIQTIHLNSNTNVLITTAAASKIYGSQDLEARQQINVQVDSGATLEWLPQETIVFNNAIYRQDLRVELAPGASWLGWEITRFGRSAGGEKFLQGDWRSHTEIWQQGHPLWIDRQWLPASETVFNSPHGLAGKPVVGTLAWVGQSVAPETVAEARRMWDTHLKGETGVTRLPDGLLCRYRGFSTAEARHWFTQVWGLVRLTFCHRKPIKPRVWF